MAEPSPAWIKDGRIFVEHERRGGWVFGHLQAPEDAFIGFWQFARITEGDLAKTGAAPFDVRALDTYPGDIDPAVMQRHGLTMDEEGRPVFKREER